VLGGVTPFPFALLAPITLTSSFTDTPCNSGGISLLIGKAFFAVVREVVAGGTSMDGANDAAGEDLLAGEELPDPPATPDPPRVDVESSDLNHFWKKDFLSTVPDLLLGVGGVGGAPDLLLVEPRL